MNLSLKQLQNFSQFAKYKNVSLAASKLGVTQPALTASLRKIEGDLGVELFSRSSGNISLNKKGQLLAPQIDRLLSGFTQVTEAAENIAKDPVSTQSHICIPASPWTSSLRSYLISDPRFKLRSPERHRRMNRLFDANIVFHFCNNFAKPGFQVAEIMEIWGMCSAMKANSQMFEPANKYGELLVPDETLLVGVRQMLRSQVGDEAGLGTKINHELDRYDQIVASAQCPQNMAILPGSAAVWAKQYGNLLDFTDIEEFAKFRITVSLVTPLNTKLELISELKELVEEHLLIS